LCLAWFFMKIGVVANSEVCLPLLYYLKNNKAEVSLFFGGGSVLDKGRAEVAEFCATQQVLITEEKAEQDLYNWANSEKPDIIFVAGYSSRIKVKQLPEVKGDIFNIHFGKLPEFRGANPVFWQLKENVPALGLTIHHLSDKLDAGAIVWSKEIPNQAHFNYSFVNRLFSNTLVEGVHYILSTCLMGLPLPAKPQDEKNAFSYPKPKLKDVSICWSTLSATKIAALVKASNSWNIGAITSFGGMEVKIIDAAPSNVPTSGSFLPGTIIHLHDTILTMCGEGTFINLFAISLNGVYVPARLAANVGFSAGKRFEPVIC
jgi:methionyl-tRNA formyltransferase